VEREYAPLYRDHGMGTTIWSPLASGLLTGKYNHGVPADSRLAQPGYEWLKGGVLGDPASRRVERARRFSTLAKELGVAPAPLAIADDVIVNDGALSVLDAHVAALDAQYRRLAAA
jgi:aryl-alcohol dehydrogenase-like predicted oxidoreductase